MEQPEIFTPAAYHELLASLQPVYGLTAGLTNKMVSKAVAQVLERCAPAQDYLPEKIRARYELCEINYALHEVHFPKDQEHLATARRRIVFEEFFLFILSLRQLKEQTEGITNVFPIRAVWKTEEVIENMPYRLTNAQMRVWHGAAGTGRCRKRKDNSGVPCNDYDSRERLPVGADGSDGGPGTAAL